MSNASKAQAAETLRWALQQAAIERVSLWEVEAMVYKTFKGNK